MYANQYLNTVNQDGKTVGMTVPSNQAQAALIREAYARAGLDINDVQDRPQFFHAHGTGTQAGDPQEAQAISQSFFGDGKVTDTLYVGSIKTVIGYVSPLLTHPCQGRPPAPGEKKG